jgi:hypothetical protein
MRLIAALVAIEPITTIMFERSGEQSSLLLGN